MSTLKVLKVGEKAKEFESKYGKLYTWTVQGELDGEPGIVQITTKKPEHGLTIGETLNGTVEHTDYGTKFKREQQAFGSKNSGYTPRAEDPEKQAMIIRQNALGNAVAFQAEYAKLHKKADAFTTDNVLLVAAKFAAFSIGELKPTMKQQEPLPEPDQINADEVNELMSEEAPF